MKTKNPTRRQFIVTVSGAGILTATSRARGSDYSPSLYNVNYQTAIGLGDEPATVVDRFGQLKSDDANGPELANAARGGGSRNGNLLIQVGKPMRAISTFKSKQALEDGYLPIVRSQVRAANGFFKSVAFSSDSGGVKADYVGIMGGANSFRITILCPIASVITADNGVIYADNRILALAPTPSAANIHNARYNCLTPERNSRTFPSAVAWEGLPRLECPRSLDIALSGARTGTPYVEYRFPIAAGKTYRVYIGVGNPVWLVGDINYFRVVKIFVNEQSKIVDLHEMRPDRPSFHEFTVTPADANIYVRSQGVAGGPLVSAIWIFDQAADPELVKSGKLNHHALYYVRCGKEPAEDLISSIELKYVPSATADATTWIQLPYELSRFDLERVRSVSPLGALSEAKARWRGFVEQGAQFTTGIPRLDNLYKTSLINLFLLRTKYPGQGTEGRDIYAVKPGLTVYDSFWYRDGSYMIAAMDAAGHPEEAEKSLRLFSDRALTGTLKTWAQQSDGLWESPSKEWDSQGQAIWALVHHFQLTGDLSWLRGVYDNIRSGALWIKRSTQVTKKLDHGEKPIFWGLLEKGVSEDTGASGPAYIYEHDFWAAFGLQNAIVASQCLHADSDTRWMTETYEEFRVNLLASVKRAFSEVGGNQFIPADTLDSTLDINGDIAAVYPTRFLDPRNPMVSSSLRRIASHSRELLYTWFKTLNNGDMWTYMTADWAMCYLLRDDLTMFHRLFQAYVNHASPTNGWPECIYIKSRLGTGDTPHGWAAAAYMLLYRNSLLYENGNNLELCWGVVPDWLTSGSHLSVKAAPTKFGLIDFDLRRSRSVITFEHRLVSSTNQTKPQGVRLHIPAPLRGEIAVVRLNGRLHKLRPDESFVQID